MNREPILLVAPATLHHDEQLVIWQAGVVLGPPGIVVVNMDIQSAEHREQWGDPQAQPVDAYIEAPQVPWRVVGENGFGADWFTLKFHARMPSVPPPGRPFEPLTPELLAGARLHIDIHPFDLHFALDLSPQ